MKIRLQDNIMIYRLSKKDKNVLLENGFITYDIKIGDEKLHFCLKSREIENPKLELESGKVHAIFPAQTLKNWLESDIIELQHRFMNSDNEPIELLLEKDLKEF